MRVIVWVALWLLCIDLVLQFEIRALDQNYRGMEAKVEMLQRQLNAIPREHTVPDGTKLLRGEASYYDYTLKSGWSSIGHFVCAARDFPRGTTLRVTNATTGASTTCAVKDYGPDANVFPERIVDLSSTAFAAIAPTRLGVVPVVVQPL